VKKASRLFALGYTLLAGLIAITRFASGEATLPLVPWSLVSLSAIALGVVAVAWRPLTLLCAAHAGLTVTWAGTLAPGIAAQSQGVAIHVVSLLVLAAGMTGMIAFGLKSARLAAARTSPPR
jgi:hypothetical protein